MQWLWQSLPAIPVNCMPAVVCNFFFNNFPSHTPLLSKGSTSRLIINLAVAVSQTSTQATLVFSGLISQPILHPRQRPPLGVRDLPHLLHSSSFQSCIAQHYDPSDRQPGRCTCRRHQRAHQPWSTRCRRLRPDFSAQQNLLELLPHQQ
jgi:hypothetical protein